MAYSNEPLIDDGGMSPSLEAELILRRHDCCVALGMTKIENEFRELFS